MLNVDRINTILILALSLAVSGIGIWMIKTDKRMKSLERKKNG